MENKFIFLNLKSFLKIDEQIEYFEKLNNIDSKNIVVFIPSISLYLSDQKKYNFYFGSQSFSYLPMGPYTNSVTLEQISYFKNISYTLINHNDEIKNFSHNCNKLYKQLKIFESYKLKALLCFSEIYEHETIDSKVNELFQQLSSLIENCNIDEKRIVFSYEPKALINSSISFEAKDMNYIIKNLKEKIKQKYNKSFKFAYGGNINENNFNEIYKQPDIDALLIGRLSLDTVVLKKLIEENENN